MIRLMIFGKEEWVINHDPERKANYILENYDENLVMKACKDIYIRSYSFEIDGYTIRNKEFLKFKEQEQRCTFDFALRWLKNGFKVARRGWNGKDMYLYLVNSTNVEKDKLINEASKHNNCDVTFLSHIDMKTSDGTICVGWLASQTDLLSDDWYIVNLNNEKVLELINSESKEQDQEDAEKEILKILEERSKQRNEENNLDLLEEIKKKKEQISKSLEN
jgi:hypothetical protein